MREITKKRIISIVRSFRKVFPKEYELAASGNRQRASNQKTKWGETLNGGVVEREVLRMPTSLHTILYMKLTPEEIQELESKKGLIWFQRTFPEWVPNMGKE
jgi:hypothetical protein